MRNKVLHCLLILLVCCVRENVTKNANAISDARTIITTRNVTYSSPKIHYEVLKKPHHLLIGRCYPEHNILHQEHIIVKNDGKSHVEANIKINIDGPVNITCVQIYDEMLEDNGYPIYSGGGVGQNYVAFIVRTDYGKGFHFFVRIFGIEVQEK